MGLPGVCIDVENKKLDSKFEKYRFVGYSKDSLWYYIYFPTNPRVVVARHVVFLEEKFIQKGGMGKKIDLEENESSISQILDQIIEQGEPSQGNHPQILRRSDKVSHPLNRWYGLSIEEIHELYLYGIVTS